MRVGDELSFTSPLVLGFGFGNWRLQPADGTPEGTFAPQNTRPAGARRGRRRRADRRVQRAELLPHPGGDGGRGARDAAEFEKQAAKIVTAIEALDADVVTLMEIEDTNSTGYGDGTPDQALADLVRAAQRGRRLRQVGLRPAARRAARRRPRRDPQRDHLPEATSCTRSATPVGLVDETVWFNAREPIAQTFVKDGDTVHRRSPTTSSPRATRPAAGGNDNVDIGDGQGAFNGDRTRQAAVARGFAESCGDRPATTTSSSWVTSTPTPRRTRSRSCATPASPTSAPCWTRAATATCSTTLSGSLDHAMATDALTDKVTGVAHWNINAVESFAYQYDGDPALYAANPFRSSDHDPLVLGIDLEERCAGCSRRSAAPTGPTSSPAPTGVT